MDYRNSAWFTDLRCLDARLMGRWELNSNYPAIKRKYRIFHYELLYTQGICTLRNLGSRTVLISSIDEWLDPDTGFHIIPINYKQRCSDYIEKWTIEGVIRSNRSKFFLQRKVPEKELDWTPYFYGHYVSANGDRIRVGNEKWAHHSQSISALTEDGWKRIGKLTVSEDWAVSEIPKYVLGIVTDAYNAYRKRQLNKKGN